MPEHSPAPPELILIAKSEVVDYRTYHQLPLDRIDLYWDLVQLRMTYFNGGFRPFLELLNQACFGRYWIESEAAQRRSMFSIWNLPSLNGYLAASSVVAAGFRVCLLNNFDAESDRLQEFAVGHEKPLVGISTTFILNWSEVSRLVKQVRKLLPAAVFVLGGAFVHDQAGTHGPEKFEASMRKLGISFVLYGYNSEDDLLALVRARAGHDFTGVKNLAWLDDQGGFHAAPLTWTPPHLEAGAIPWEQLVLHSKLMQVRASSGCPFHCAFCTYPVTAKGYHTMELEALKQQLDVLAKLGVQSLIFIDDTFNVPMERFRKIVELLGRYHFRWYSFFRAQFADQTLVTAMRSSGCDGVYLGLESANDQVLAAMDKKVTVADYERGLGLLKAAGIPTFAAFVLGYPGETPATLADNAAFIENACPDFYSLKEFYYLHSAAVHARRETYVLTGEGNNWSHATMDSQAASAAKHDLFQRIRGSIYVDSDSGLWLLAYLRSEGFAWQEIRRLLSLYNEMVRLDLEKRFEDKAALFAEFKQTAARRQPC